MMMQPRPTIECPGCRVRYFWKPALAGRKFRCSRCRAKFRLPTEPTGEPALLEPPDASLVASSPEPSAPPPTEQADGGDHVDESASYAFDEPHPETPQDAAPSIIGSEPETRQRCPQCGSRVSPEAVICLNCGFHLARGERLSTVVGDESLRGSREDGIDEDTDTSLPEPPLPAAEVHRDPETEARLYEQRVAYDEQVRADMDRQHRRESFTIPIVLAQIGLLMILLNAFWLRPWAIESSGFLSLGPPPTRFQVAALELTEMATQVLAQVPCVLLALVLIARIFGSAFGTLLPALLKLNALLLLTDGMDRGILYSLDIFTGGWGIVGQPLRFALTFGVFLWLCIWLFEMEFMEVVVMYFAAFILPIVLLLILSPALQAAFF